MSAFIELNMNSVYRHSHTNPPCTAAHYFISLGKQQYSENCGVWSHTTNNTCKLEKPLNLGRENGKRYWGEVVIRGDVRGLTVYNRLKKFCYKVVFITSLHDSAQFQFHSPRITVDISYLSWREYVSKYIIWFNLCIHLKSIRYALSIHVSMYVDTSTTIHHGNLYGF